MRTGVDVHNFLVELDVPHEVFAARGRFRAPERIAPLLGLVPGEVGKVLVFEDARGPLAVVVPAPTDPDPKRVRKATRRRHLERVSDDRASELTGYLPESIPPAGLPQGFAVVVDSSLDRDDVLYFPGGEARTVLKVRGADLVRALGAKVADLSAAG